jgi:branched-chain amino acid transport system ATP-binding protein
MTAQLRVSTLEASYGAVRALRGVSILVEAGSIVALLGANGAGKSSTLKAISGMLKPAAGVIEFDGARLDGASPDQIVCRGVAHVPEGRRIFKDLTVAENLLMGGYARDDKGGIARDLGMVYSLFPRLKERQSQLGGCLSGGEQQMLAVGRGLMAHPKLLMLDEPSLGLAPIILSEIFSALRRINIEERMTLLVVEQNAHVALKNASYGYVLQVGRVVVEGTAEQLRSDRHLLESYLGAAPV